MEETTLQVKTFLNTLVKPFFQTFSSQKIPNHKLLMNLSNILHNFKEHHLLKTDSQVMVLLRNDPKQLKYAFRCNLP